jgi:hypothetical protein
MCKNHDEWGSSQRLGISSEPGGFHWTTVRALPVTACVASASSALSRLQLGFTGKGKVPEPFDFLEGTTTDFLEVFCSN